MRPSCYTMSSQDPNPARTLGCTSTGGPGCRGGQRSCQRTSVLPSAPWPASSGPPAGPVPGDPGPPPGRLGEVAVPVCDWAEGEGEGDGGGETADDGVDACDTPAQVDGCRPGERPEGDGRPGQDLGDAYHPPVELGRDDRLAQGDGVDVEQHAKAR